MLRWADYKIEITAPYCPYSYIVVVPPWLSAGCKKLEFFGAHLLQCVTDRPEEKLPNIELPEFLRWATREIEVFPDITEIFFGWPHQNVYFL